MQTFDEIHKAMLGRLAEFTDRYPKGRSTFYRRIGVRQQQLFAHAARENPEYFGTSALGTVEDGECDFADIAAPVDTPERITKIVVTAMDTDDLDDDAIEALGFTVGAEVSVVPIADPDGVKPRATFRDNILRGVDGELDTVTEIEVHYPRRPEPTAVDEDGTRTVEIADPYSELLVIDLLEYAAKMTPGVEKSVVAAIAAATMDEKQELLAGFTAHARGYSPMQSRFHRPPSGARPDA